MITTRSSQDGLTFLHDGSPEGGKLRVVINRAKIDVELERYDGDEYVVFDVEYNTVRDFILRKLADREIARLEQMSGEELAAYYTGDWEKLDKQ